jgi:hypothetical protein
MLHTSSFAALLFPALSILIVTLLSTLYVTKSLIAAISVALIKAGIFLVYFHFFFDGTFTFLDDISYVREASFYHDRGITVFNLFQNRYLIFAISGNHFIYQIYNTYAFYIFGVGYFAPVALNSILMCFVALIGSRLAEVEFRLSGHLRIIFFLFLILYPSTTAWSSLVNAKDVLILFCHVSMLAGFSLLFRGKHWAGSAVLGTMTCITFFLRFYLPLMFALVFVVSASIGSSGWRKLQLIALALALLTAVTFLVGLPTIADAYGKLLAKFSNPVYGLMRFSLTPVPLHTDPNYRFLEVPAIVHWFLFPFLLIGIPSIAMQRTPYSRFFIVYFLIFVGLYSVFVELQGPRHRVQLNYAWALFEFAGLLTVLRDITQRRQRPMIYADSKG